MKILIDLYFGEYANEICLQIALLIGQNYRNKFFRVWLPWQILNDVWPVNLKPWIRYFQDFFSGKTNDILRETVASVLYLKPMPNSHGGHLANATSFLPQQLSLSDSDRLSSGTNLKNLNTFLCQTWPLVLVNTSDTLKNGGFQLKVSRDLCLNFTLHWDQYTSSVIFKLKADL